MYNGKARFSNGLVTIELTYHRTFVDAEEEVIQIVRLWHVFFLILIGFSCEISPLMSRKDSCALLGNRESSTLLVQILVTIVLFVLSSYETWLMTSS